MTKDPNLQQGIIPHLRRFSDLIAQFDDELKAMQKLAAMLREANDRLSRHTDLMGMENQLLEQLLKREKLAAQRPDVKVVPMTSLVDRVEEDLEALISDNRAMTQDAQATNPGAFRDPNPVSTKPVDEEVRVPVPR